jgi:anti-anti-sigma regulatory factor
MTVLLSEVNSHVKYILDVQKKLISTIDSDTEVILDFMKLPRADLALAQLLISGVKYARKKNVLIKFKNVSGELRNQLQLTGLIKRNKE